MSCSRSCSSRGARLLAAALAAALAACAGAPARRDPVPRPRVVLLPVENLTGKAAAGKDIQTAVELALRRKFEVVGGDILEQFLSRHRLRFTGGVDEAIAVAARDELGADGILITSLIDYRADAPPTVGIAMRLVSASERPTILWMDQRAFAGDESPGLLQLGIVDNVRVALSRVVARLVDSLDRAVDGRAGAPECGGGGRYRPKVRFAKSLPASPARSIAVLPFLNWTSRRGAGEAVSLEFVRQLVADGRFNVIEPGVVRQFLLRSRTMIPSGVSLETTRLLVGALEADLIVSGTVLEYAANYGGTGAVLRFSASVLEGHTGEVVWHSSSYNRGDEAVYFFGLGRVATTGQLVCRMVGPVVGGIAEAAGSRASFAEAPATGRDGRPDLSRFAR